MSANIWCVIHLNRVCLTHTLHPPLGAIWAPLIMTPEVAKGENEGGCKQERWGETEMKENVLGKKRAMR